MFILETRYGDKGFAFWFKTLELLGSTNGHTYHFDKENNSEYLQAYTRTDKDQAIEILDLLANLGAIDKDLWTKNRIIWSDNFVDGIRDAYRNRTVEIPPKPVSDVSNPTTIGVSDVRNAQSKVNKSKLKETIYVIPDWINKDIWEAFLEVRKIKKAAQTQYALSLIVKSLEMFKADGEDPNKILERSITNSWKDVFSGKGGQGGAHKGYTSQGNRKTTNEQRRASLNPRT